jgi:hypothetical protein
MSKKSVTQPDPAWFNDRPWRRHRVRPLTAGEVSNGVSPTAAKGCTRVAVIRRLPDCRLMTVFTTDCADLDYARLNEASASEIFEAALAAMPAHVKDQILADVEKGLP